METLILTPNDMSITPILEDFLDRPRRLKYDEYKGKLYHVVWSPEAEKMRKERQLELRRQKYRNENPLKPKKELSYYLRKKIIRVQDEYRAELDRDGNLVNKINAGTESGLRMMSSQTVSCLETSV